MQDARMIETTRRWVASAGDLSTSLPLWPTVSPKKEKRDTLKIGFGIDHYKYATVTQTSCNACY